MATHDVGEARPKPNALINQVADGKDTVEPAAHRTHVATAELDLTAINQRLATSEKTPAAPWISGDASRLAKQVLQRTSGR